MFESFESRLDGEQHKIPKEQLTKIAEGITENVVFVISEETILVDRDGSMYIVLDEKVYGNSSRDDCHDLESFLFDEDCAPPIFLVKTPEGYIVDCSEAYEEDFDYVNTVAIPDYQKSKLGKVIGFTETHHGAEQLYGLMEERYGTNFAEQTNELLAELGSLTSQDEED